MEHNQTKRGNWGWLGLVAFVGTFDYISEETMTHAYQRGLEGRTKPYVLAGLGITALHLLDVIPRQYDPFYVLSGQVDNLVSKIRSSDS